MNTSQGTII